MTNQTKLAALRIAAGLSQAQLAAAAEIKLGTLQKYESRERNINAMNILIAYKLSKVLSCTIEDLLEPTEK